jgi:hypothetical protein
MHAAWGEAVPATQAWEMIKHSCWCRDSSDRWEVLLLQFVKNEWNIFSWTKTFPRFSHEQNAFPLFLK